MNLRLCLVRQISEVRYFCQRSDRSVSAHSITPRETIAAYSADIAGATAYELTGTSNFLVHPSSSNFGMKVKL